MDPTDGEATPHGGLGCWQMPVVLDPRLAAPRGAEHTNAWQNKRAYLGDSLFEGQDDGSDEEDVVRSSIATAISSDNVGYQMLIRMGWSEGKGLGRHENGIKEPIKVGVEKGVVLGLGKQAQDDFYTKVENVNRKRLETELQATEDDSRKERREAEAERAAKIKLDVEEIKKTFLCELCNKQYNLAVELDVHLSSYDHNHKKRLAEMRATEANRTRGEREKREKRKAEKEMTALHGQAARAAAAAAKASGGAAAKPNPAPASIGGGAAPPPPSSASTAVGWSSAQGIASTAAPVNGSWQAPLPPDVHAQAGSWSAPPAQAYGQQQYSSQPQQSWQGTTQYDQQYNQTWQHQQIPTAAAPSPPPAPPTEAPPLPSGPPPGSQGGCPPPPPPPEAPPPLPSEPEGGCPAPPIPSTGMSISFGMAPRGRGGGLAARGRLGGLGRGGLGTGRGAGRGVAAISKGAFAESSSDEEQA